MPFPDHGLKAARRGTYEEWANWLVYAFDKLTEKLQDKEMNAYFAGLKTSFEAPSRLSGSGPSRPSPR